MPRPPSELRKLEDEEHRRAQAHRRLRWERRFRVSLWVLGVVGLLLAIALIAWVAGLFPG